MLILLNDPQLGGAIFSAYGRNDRIAEALVTTLTSPDQIPLRQLVVLGLKALSVPRRPIPMGQPSTD